MDVARWNQFTEKKYKPKGKTTKKESGPMTHSRVRDHLSLSRQEREECRLGKMNGHPSPAKEKCTFQLRIGENKVGENVQDSPHSLETGVNSDRCRNL